MNITMRLLPRNMQASGIAMQSTLARLFGSIPGPIAFGAILDTACVIWEKDDCGENGSCLLFDTLSTSNMFFGQAMISRTISLIILIGQYVLAKKRDAVLDRNNKNLEYN